MATSFDRINAYPEADIPLPRLRTICHLWTCAGVLASAGVAALAFDVPLASWVQSGKCPDLIHKLCSLSEVFGHGLGVTLIVVTIAVLDPWHRYAIPRILAAGLGSGLLANVFKLLLARTRPHHFDLQGQALDTFSNWLPMLGGHSWEQSFPSAHTATAAGLAIVLASFYPRGRWMFPAFAAMAGAQRVFEHSHFASDAFWGAAIGCIFAPLCVYGSRISRAFDRLEERLVVRSVSSIGLQGPHRRSAKVAGERRKPPGADAA
jgi:membrane-associated phospholipid phosphatase